MPADSRHRCEGSGSEYVLCGSCCGNWRAACIAGATADADAQADAGTTAARVEAISAADAILDAGNVEELDAESVAVPYW